MKLAKPRTDQLLACLHAFLLLNWVIYSGVGALVWLATCRLSDSYLMGIELVHRNLDPTWGLIAMHVLALCFWLLLRAEWVIRQLLLGVWGLLGFCWFAFVVLRLNSSPEHRFAPASDVLSTVLRSIAEPNVSTGSFLLLIVGSVVLANCLTVLHWLRLLEIDQAQLAWRRARILGLAFLAPLLVVLPGLFLSDPLSIELSAAFLFVFIGTPIFYLASCAALYCPEERYLVMLLAPIIPSIPQIIFGEIWTTVLVVPTIFICAIISASDIQTAKIRH